MFMIPILYGPMICRFHLGARRLAKAVMSSRSTQTTALCRDSRVEGTVLMRITNNTINIGSLTLESTKSSILAMKTPGSNRIVMDHFARVGLAENGTDHRLMVAQWLLLVSTNPRPIPHSQQGGSKWKRTQRSGLLAFTL